MRIFEREPNWLLVSNDTVSHDYTRVSTNLPLVCLYLAVASGIFCEIIALADSQGRDCGRYQMYVRTHKKEQLDD